MSETWNKYRKAAVTEMRPWVEGDDMTGVTVNDTDRSKGHPKAGDQIARDPSNPRDRWLVSGPFFAKNYEPAVD